MASLGAGSIVLLIFGGCCSNVFALEALLQSNKTAGLLITFTQFLLTASAAYTLQFSPSSPWTVKPPRVPFGKWAFIAALHFGINMLNNWAFAYSISVPVHIILRSFGSVTTMVAGVARGKRYSALQVGSVVLLTTGVLVSAWADSEGKGKSMNMASKSSGSDFRDGLVILLLAQFLSAYMGAYVEDTYARHGASWTENLFYTHFLSLPLFFPLAGMMRDQYARLAASPSLQSHHLLTKAHTLLPSALLDALSPLIDRTPRGLLFLSLNAATQLACISGVNLLSAKTSAVTVTIVLNIRKLVSFIFSTVLFGHELSAKMILGSVLVFGSGALYGWETSWRLPRERARVDGARQKRTRVEGNGKVEGNGTVEKKKA